MTPSRGATRLILMSVVVWIGAVIAGPPPARAATPPRALDQVRADSADSLYQIGRKALNDGANTRAVALFRELARRYPTSPYAAEARYWEAYALFNSGEPRQLRVALTLLNAQLQRYPNSNIRGDALELATRVRGRLAELGDPSAARDVARAADPGRDDSAEACDRVDSRIAALMALQNLDSTTVVPTLQRLFTAHGPCSTELRQRALPLLAVPRSPAKEAILVSVATSDPDADVRRSAIGLLLQSKSDTAIAGLAQALRSAPDDDAQAQIVRALLESRNPRARPVLRSVAADSAAPAEARDLAVRGLLGTPDESTSERTTTDGRNPAGDWYGPRLSAADLASLRAAYPTLQTDQLKDQIVRAAAGSPDIESVRWALSMAVAPNASDELRATVLAPVVTRWGQEGRAGPAPANVVAALIAVYDSLDTPALKQQLIAVLSHQGTDPAVEKLGAIAKHDADASVRQAAIAGLVRSKNPHAATLLSEIVTQ